MEEQEEKTIIGVDASGAEKEFNTERAMTAIESYEYHKEEMLAAKGAAKKELAVAKEIAAKNREKAILGLKHSNTKVQEVMSICYSWRKLSKTKRIESDVLGDIKLAIGLEEPAPENKNG